MHAPPARFVLGLGLGALIQPTFTLAGWLLWQLDTRRTR